MQDWRQVDRPAGGSGQHGGQYVLALHADVEQVHAEPNGYRYPGQVQLCGSISGLNQSFEAGAVREHL